MLLCQLMLYTAEDRTEDSALSKPETPFTRGWDIVFVIYSCWGQVLLKLLFSQRVSSLFLYLWRDISFHTVAFSSHLLDLQWYHPLIFLAKYFIVSVHLILGLPYALFIYKFCCHIRLEICFLPLLGVQCILVWSMSLLFYYVFNLYIICNTSILNLAQTASRSIII